MDINQILFLIAVLNLAGDLYNIIRFRHHIPRWVLPANLAALACCGLAKFFAPNDSGTIALLVLLAYVLAIRLRSRSRAKPPAIPSPATKLLISINACVYAAQVYRNAIDDPYRMVLMGAAYSPLLERGEWWRLVTAQFLHWGFAHVFLNMLGLWFLGRTVEAFIGSYRFIMAYLICGAGGMAVAWGVSTIGPEPHIIVLVGASASVLGLVGLEAAIALKAFRYSGSLVAKAQLSSMTQIIVLQAIFDWMVPQVSSTAHLGGAFIGFLLGALVVRPRVR